MPYKDPEKARECARRNNKRYRARYPERAIAATMKWRAKNADYVKQYEREYKRRVRIERPEVEKNRQLMCMYGVTLEWKRAKSEEQGGLCAICRRAPSGPGFMGVLHIDHDHASGKARELLCSHCNQAIGRLREDPELCRAAANYLEKHKGDADARKD